jgi:hypothetical protein
MTGGCRTGINLQKIKVVENKEHSQNDVDNHTGQNYNVEQF